MFKFIINIIIIIIIIMVIRVIVIIIISIFNINFITAILIMVNGYSYSLKLSHPMSAHMYQLLV